MTYARSTVFSFFSLLYCGLFLIFLAPQLSLANELNIQDDLKRTVKLTKPARKIISLSPHITELLFYLEQGDKVIAIDESSDYPRQTSSLPKIGNAFQVSIEEVIRLKPDLIIAWASTESTSKSLKLIQDMGIPIFYSEPKSLEDIARTMERISILTGNTATSLSKIEEFRSKVESFSKSNANTEQASPVFYQVWNKPLMTLNGEHIVSEIIELCGGRNIFEELKITAPQVNLEAVIERNPSLIISSDNQREFWDNWKTIDAVKQGNFLAVNPDHLVRPGPRILLGAEKICEAIAQLN